MDSPTTESLLKEGDSSTLEKSSSRSSSEISEYGGQHFVYARNTARQIRQTKWMLYGVTAVYVLTVILVGILFSQMRNDFAQCRKLDLFPCKLTRDATESTFVLMKTKSSRRRPQSRAIQKNEDASEDV